LREEVLDDADDDLEVVVLDLELAFVVPAIRYKF
jgi:hypothetical protein